MAHHTGCVVVCMILGTVSLAAGQESTSKPETPESLAHIETARQLAGEDLRAPFDFFCVPVNARANRSDAPELEPVKLFDDLYAVGNSETTVYALPTSDGIILIDAGYADRVESVLEPGLRTLGLDPANVRYILVAHGHADHFGGAAYFQDRYGTQVGMAAADWDVVERRAVNNTSAPKPPSRDFAITDGDPIQLGGRTITPVLTPGHTPGSLAFLFPVQDNGETRMVGLFGGTMLASFLRTPTPALQEYIGSIDHYLEVARTMKVEVEVQNHPIFDDMAVKLAALEARESDAPHPFVIGAERFLRFWRVVSECTQAEVARRDD